MQTTANGRILIIDDTPLMHRDFRKTLTSAAGADDLDEMEAMASVDMRMPPGWDGVETIERLWEALAARAGGAAVSA